ncbi:MAG TPA: glycosyltransferase family 4 protein [Gemmatimonadales bacterium]|nr:glycosyltransferase family 4 protein [Gemmatimonadales bacterium]
MKVLCVTSDLLGNFTFSAHLLDAIRTVPWVQMEVVRLCEEDYREHEPPAWMRKAGPFRTRYVLQRKLRQVDVGSCDAIFLEFWEAALAFDHWLTRRPVALAMDLVPTLASELSLQNTASTWRRELKRTAWRLYDREFRKSLTDVDVFAPICQWVANGLTRDYGIDDSQVGVTYVPLNVQEWRPRESDTASTANDDVSPQDDSRATAGQPRPKRLLFVGNDFRRKGGERLLDLYREHLSDIATLTIASRDPILEHVSIPPGVTLLRDCLRKDLLEVYQASDLFVFPTRLDILPNAIGEALATGTPCIATDIGGISELVRHGETGVLLPFHASTSEWGAQIRALLQDDVRLERLSQGARRFAEETLGLDRFNHVVAEVLDQLKGSRSRYGRS